MSNKKSLTAISLVTLFLLSAYAPLQQRVPVFSSLKTDRTLIIDKSFIESINKQAAIDAPEEVVLFADSIIITASDTFGNFDLQLYTNFFKIEPNKGLTIVPSGSGQNGKNIVLFAKKVDQAIIHLPGTPGKTGTTGKNGRDGDQKRMEEDEEKISIGTRGEPGQKGEKGGDGGNLIVHSLTNTSLLTLVAKGGQGGAGGEGGQGGLTFFRPITKIINEGKPNEKKIFGAVQSKREPNGGRGPAGEKGKDGIVTKSIVTETKFDEMAAKAYKKDWKNIATNGWRIVFRNKEI